MQNACFESFDRKPMSALAETNAKLSAAVQELRASTQAARRCAVDSEKLADAQRDAARSDYMKALKESQTNAQAILDSTESDLRTGDRLPRRTHV